MKWLTQTYFQLQATRFTFVILTSIAGIAIVALTVAALFRYALLIEANANIAKPYLAHEGRAETFLLPFAMLALSGLILGSSLIFWARLAAVAMFTNFLSHLNDRILLSFGPKPTKASAWPPAPMHENAP